MSEPEWKQLKDGTWEMETSFFHAQTYNDGNGVSWVLRYLPFEDSIDIDSGHIVPKSDDRGYNHERAKTRVEETLRKIYCDLDDMQYDLAGKLVLAEKENAELRQRLADVSAELIAVNYKLIDAEKERTEIMNKVSLFRGYLSMKIQQLTLNKYKKHMGHALYEYDRLFGGE